MIQIVLYSGITLRHPSFGIDRHSQKFTSKLRARPYDRSTVQRPTLRLW